MEMVPVTVMQERQPFRQRRIGTATSLMRPQLSWLAGHLSMPPSSRHHDVLPSLVQDQRSRHLSGKGSPSVHCEAALTAAVRLASESRQPVGVEHWLHHAHTVLPKHGNGQSLLVVATLKMIKSAHLMRTPAHVTAALAAPLSALCICCVEGAMLGPGTGRTSVRRISRADALQTVLVSLNVGLGVVPMWCARRPGKQDMYRGDAHIKLWKEMNELILILWAEIHDQGPVVGICDLFCHHSPHDLL